MYSLKDLMRSATRLTQAGGLRQAAEQIQRALKEAGLVGPDSLRPAGFVAPAPADTAPPASGTVLDVDAVEVDAAPTSVADGQGGDFIAGSHSHAGRSLGYKLYVPPGAEGKHLPMVVMLHGCTQDPDDFAAGTGVNELAREQGFYVLYPAQAADANPSRCWNWFKHNHQRRGSGEPAVIASLTQAVIQARGIDPDRVYVAGLSAGGAMAAILADAYPDIFAAAAVHSGLPQGAARDMTGAFTVMKTGIGMVPGPVAQARAASSVPPVPTIVFHGDRDDTVHPLNGENVIATALDAARAHADAGEAPHVTRVEHGAAPHGHSYTRTIHETPDGGVLAEHWLVHGAGHAWSGGRPAGSYTDAAGPDATREMLRFFAACAKAENALVK